jgi:site-specific DNA-cytosine methylase
VSHVSVPFVDVQGLAGAWTLGTVQAGFELVARRSLPGGFGDDSVSNNRHLVGHDWEQQTGIQDEWEAVNGVPYACGTPPCSGFSLLNTSKGKNARGSGSVINSCMRDLIRFSGRCTGGDGRRGPEVVSFESVQGAFKQGRELMQDLRAELEELTGERYDLTHVLMSGSSVGSAQMRHRYYPVFHRIPFYLERPEPTRVVTYQDAIGDLVGAKQQWEAQPYPSDDVSTWAADKRRDDGQFGDHITQHTGAFAKLVTELAPHWRAGEGVDAAVRRYGRKPDAIKAEKFLGFDHPGSPHSGKGQILKGWSWPTRVHPDKPGYVLTGGGLLSFVHYAEDRLLTVRETSRLMGYPDSWSWSFVKSPMQASLLIGKCCPVQSGRWISEWVRRAVGGDVPANDRGDVVHTTDAQAVEREFIHNSTQAYKPVLKQQLEVARG